jgi:hypothetical protein
MVTCHNFVIKSHNILHLLTSAKGTCHENDLNDVIIRKISKEKQQCSELLREVCYHPSSVAMEEGANIVMNQSSDSRFVGVDGYAFTTQISYNIQDNM